jgi:hypothetical protein
MIKFALVRLKMQDVLLKAQERNKLVCRLNITLRCFTESENLTVSLFLLLRSFNASVRLYHHQQLQQLKFTYKRFGGNQTASVQNLVTKWLKKQQTGDAVTTVNKMRMLNQLKTFLFD